MTPNELYYQTGKDTILYQSTLHREFSDRAFNLLNVSIATLGVGAILANFRHEDLVWTESLVVFGILTAIASVIVIVLSLRVLRTETWHGFPSLDQMDKQISYLNEHYPDGNLNDYTDILQSLLGDYFTLAAEQNQEILRDKSNALFLTVLALAVEIISVIAFVGALFAEW